MQLINERIALDQLEDSGNLVFDLRGAAGYGHEKRDTERQSLKQDDNQPLWPVKDHVLDGVPPVILHHSTQTHLLRHC